MLVSIWNAERTLKATRTFLLSSFINIISSFTLGLNILSIKLYTSFEERTYEHTGEGLARQRKKSAISFRNTSKSVSIYSTASFISGKEAKSCMKLLFSWKHNLRKIHFSIPSGTFFTLMAIWGELSLEKKEKKPHVHFEKLFLIYIRSWCGFLSNASNITE